MADRNLRLQLILEGLDRVTAPLKSITNASSAARRDLAETQKQLKALDALQQQVSKYKATESRYAADTAKMEENRQKLAALRNELEATEKPTKKLRSEFERAQKETAQLSARLDAGGAELQQLSAKLGAAGIDVADLARHEDRLASQTHEANQALKKQTAQLDKMGKAKANSQKMSDISAKATGVGLGMIGAGTAAGVPVVMATKQAMTLESAMADVSKVTNMVPAQIAQMSNDFIDMSEKIPMAANELATIAAAAGAAGVGMDKFGKPMRDQRRQLLEFTNDAAEMGVAFDMTADIAGETMAKWRTAFELPQAGVRALGDRVNALTNTFGGKAANVTDIITRIGPLGKVAGLAAPQIAALGSTLDSIGVPSEIAATGIKNTMLALTKGSAATKAQQASFQALGLEATDVAKRMQKDAAGTIVDVMERIGKLDPDKQAGLMTKLFGSESVAAISPMLTNLDGLKQRLSLVGNESAVAGSMHGEFLNRIATTEGATGLATNALSGLNITMGNALLPTVVKVSEEVRTAASGLRKWAQEHPGIAKAIMIFVGAGSALLILLGGMALAFAALTAAAAPLGIALGPLLLIVAAIAAVAAAAYMIYDNWGAISAWFGNLWSGIKSVVSSAFDFIVNAFLNFTPLGLLIRAFMPAINWLRSLNFGEIGRNLIQGLINGITGMLGALKNTIVNAASSVANWFKSKLGIKSPSRVFMGLGGFVMEGLDQGLAANTSGPLSRITDLSGQMTRALAVGAGGAAMAAAAPAAAQGQAGAVGAAAPAPVTYAISITVKGAGDGEDIAEQVRKAIEDIERRKRGRGFGDF
ncbi:TP901 family phage tail tape measure protein [Sphingobium wenxiniae]|uniref:TP901 family phage tail tape measure protein n=1 Tax=Sphingobium wenxiniae (strain DSM 21828 / CGMCC 1.7748 / JZ-1) TaxID=595605 RepID=A0A562KCV8_SPHWJ|nr:phage tail tape measure protein [Sphingobium wenxiniae]MBB6191498.1 TP901 family phage tail tape measure protein [Sphingobium wenxiniae]TWH93212.1 TP901 family phage tail tape measure protein [Sphingobium wenxiniae]